MRNFLLTLILVFCFSASKSQNLNSDSKRFIEVTGSAEMEIVPDEIIFQIGIQEYWKEEFQKNAQYKDYVTKIPIEEIEKNLMAELAKAGINQDQIILSDAGNYWRSEGKNFKKSKTIDIVLKDFKMIETIMAEVDTKGINYMKIVKLKNKNLTEYRKQVKIEAMKAAKEKAAYLLESAGETLGHIISAVEKNDKFPNFWQPQNPMSNSILSAPDNDSENDKVKKN